MALADKKEVFKHSAAIQISNEVNLLQRRAWNVLLANAFDELANQEEHQVSIKELSETLNFDSKNEAYLKETLRALRRTEVEWNILKKDGKNEWGITGLLAEARIVNGVCIYSYGPNLRKKLHNPSIYARISLSLQNKFESKHTLALYELFVDYYKIGETPIISLIDFRKLLGLSKKDYEKFRDLNYCVIKKTLKEINFISDLIVEVEYQKRGREVTHVKFYIKKNPNKITEPLNKKSEQKQLSFPLPEFDIDNQELFQVLMSDFGVSKKKAMEILKTYDEFYIQEVLTVVKSKIEAGKVKDIPSFTVTAIEEDYRIKKNKFELKEEEKQSQKAQMQHNQQMIEKIREEFEKHRQEKIEEYLKSISEKRKAQILKSFEEDKIKKGIISQIYQEKGFSSPMIIATYNCYVADEYLSNEDVDFVTYSQKRGYKIEKKTDGEYKIISG